MFSGGLTRVAGSGLAPALSGGEASAVLARRPGLSLPVHEAFAAALTAIYPGAGNPFAPLLICGRRRGWSRGRSRGWLISGPGRGVNHYVDITGTSGRKVAVVTPALGARGYPSRPENTPQGRFATPNSESGGSSGQVAVRHPPR